MKTDYTAEQKSLIELVINSDSLIIFRDASALWQKINGLKELMQTIPIKNNQQREAMAHLTAAVDMQFEIFMQEINGFRDHLKIAADLPV